MESINTWHYCGRMSLGGAIASVICSTVLWVLCVCAIEVRHAVSERVGERE